MQNKNEGPSTADKKVINFKKDIRTLWLIEVLYAVKREFVWFIGSLESCTQKYQGPNSKDEIVISLLSPFRSRHRDIVTYRGNDCNQKGSPRVHGIIGRLHAKNLGPKSRDGSLDQRRVVRKID